MTMNTILSTMLLSDALYAIALGAILSIGIRKYIRRSNWQNISGWVSWCKSHNIDVIAGKFFNKYVDISKLPGLPSNVLELVWEAIHKNTYAPNILVSADRIQELQDTFYKEIFSKHPNMTIDVTLIDNIKIRLQYNADKRDIDVYISLSSLSTLYHRVKHGPTSVTLK